MKAVKKILVVDDDHLIVKMISVALEARSYDVLTAYDGREGLVSALKNEPDLILLDIMMPVMGGLEMLEELRTVSRIPVIIVSAYGNPETLEKARALGIECFLNKPFQIESLVEMIEIVFDLSSFSDFSDAGEMGS